MTPSDIQQEIRQRLAALEPVLLDMRDDSALHAGHTGNMGGGHFTLTLVSSQFHGKSKIMRHRAIYQMLQDLMPGSIHALSISAYTPDEYQSNRLQPR